MSPLAKFTINRQERISQINERVVKFRFSFKIKAFEKTYPRHIMDIPRITF